MTTINLSTLTTTSNDSEEMIHKQVIKGVSALANSAVYENHGPATVKTVQSALALLRGRSSHPDRQVVAMVSPSLAGIMRQSGLFADIEIIECNPSTDLDSEYSMLFFEGAIGVALSDIKHKTVKARLTGWRKYLMPWTKRTEMLSHARYGCAIIDQNEVQGIRTPKSASSNVLALLKVVPCNFVDISKWNWKGE